jgi:hypothetical protein
MAASSSMMILLSFPSSTNRVASRRLVASAIAASLVPLHTRVAASTQRHPSYAGSGHNPNGHHHSNEHPRWVYGRSRSGDSISCRGELRWWLGLSFWGDFQHGACSTRWGSSWLVSQLHLQVCFFLDRFYCFEQAICCKLL